MSIEEYPVFYNKRGERYQKVWIAAMNLKEFQRLMRFENCEEISIPSNCDEITLKLNEEASCLATIEAQKPMRSFLVASQLFIGLIYVHEQQVKFLYDLASRYTLPTKFLIENQDNVSKSQSEEELNHFPERSPKKKKALKRKSSTKVQGNLKRKTSMIIDSTDESVDIEAVNLTMELLQNATVSNNADISIRETIDESKCNGKNDPVYLCDIQFGEDTLPEPCGFGNVLLEDDFMSMTLSRKQSDDDIGVPVNILESTRRRSSIGFGGNIYGESKIVENTETVRKEGVEMELDPHGVVDSIEMNTLEESNATENNNVLSRKRKRVRRKHQPFKDLTLIVNVKENVKSATTTQRHLNSKDDSVSKNTCLSNLSRKIFNEPSHSVFSEAMARQFEPRSMSDKLLQSFKRMTITKTEETNPDLVQEYCANLIDANEPVASLPSIENTILIIPPDCQGNELSLPEVECSVNGCNSQPASMSTEEHVLAPDVVEQSSIYQHKLVELTPAIRQILVANETENSFTRCDTDSQKLFASRSRRNKLDWGPENVLQKLISLWNSGVYPIGMNEIMQSNNRRISAATAFFSVMELNSARIGLINITKRTNSNDIFDIVKSPKLVELQQMM